MVDTNLLWFYHLFCVLLEGFSTEAELFVCPGAGPQNLLNSEHKIVTFGFMSQMICSVSAVAFHWLFTTSDNSLTHLLVDQPAQFQPQL